MEFSVNSVITVANTLPASLSRYEKNAEITAVSGGDETENVLTGGGENSVWRGGSGGFGLELVAWLRHDIGDGPI
ncbi:hypothetical protein CA54_08430 [Symmachiella macrocystis]|uniref:Uncharacterized protein n=1 Tax=Symmachiella macrocystis TaxID=2527985 RepID=A0A5C6BK42_9PLAN|nr:hypothetical protein CA54_08430 [Symmachiella macrocystis]